ncbi:GNAT family N-acetyltransferase [Methanoregula sp.]|uniref:GNAT family N-acetyltransferase n=1 Tax=Methanoregula sp. TaxID=2052170 RepID=UPI002373F07A|nr:GNAT family N-acetyltransferase [Methanoregula sp.]MDD1685372.1 GNAT family N-acetyltransferase [Methanoregula sp.]
MAFPFVSRVFTSLRRIRIRFVRIQDSDLPIARQIYDYHSLHSTATFRQEPVPPEEFRQSLDTTSSRYPSFLIREDADSMGYCGLNRYHYRNACDRSAKVTVYLKPEYTGKAIGKIALGYLEAQARQSGIRVLIAIITGENVVSRK